MHSSAKILVRIKIKRFRPILIGSTEILVLNATSLNRSKKKIIILREARLKVLKQISVDEQVTKRSVSLTAGTFARRCSVSKQSRSSERRDVGLKTDMPICIRIGQATVQIYNLSSPGITLRNS